MGNKDLLKRLGGVPAFTAMLAEAPDEHLVLFDSIVSTEMHKRLEGRKNNAQAEGALDTDLLYKVIEVVERKIRRGELRLTLARKVELIILAYETMLEEEAKEREVGKDIP